MKKILITLGIFLASATAMAQVSNVMYSSTRVPQANALNPAFYPERNSMYLALPGVNMQLQSPLSFNDILRYDEEAGQTNVDLNHLISTLAENGDLNLDANIHLAGLGLKVGHGFLTASAMVKTQTHLGFPKGLMTFLNDGNYPHRGEALELVDGSLLNVQAYSEVAVGYGRELIEGLSVGARLKVMNGLLSASTSGSSLSLTTSEDLSSMQANLATRVQISMDSNMIANKSFITNNWGWGLDLGARYKWGMFDFSAAVTDLGPGITWSDNVMNIVPKNGQDGVFRFEGIDVSSLISGGSLDSNITNSLRDSLMSMLQYEVVEGESFVTRVPTKVSAGVMVNPISILRAGVLFHGEIDRFVNAEDAFTKLRSNTTVLGNVNLNDWVEVMVSASIVGDGDNVSWFNPGVGVNLSLMRSIQLYAMVDYISNIRLVECKSFNLAFGLNLLLGNRGK